ncbi:MAG: tetratricopeptide repeat protein [Planctomycetaceae bacterium]
MSNASTTSAARGRRAVSNPAGNAVRLLLVLATVGAGTIAVIGGVSWWQDRPLRSIRAAIDDQDFTVASNLADSFLARYPYDTRALLLKGRCLSELGQHASADHLFQRIARQSNGFPDDSDALRAWSVSLLNLEQWTRAIAIMETLTESFPDDAELLYPLTVARIRLSQYEPALESAERLAKIPGHEQEAAVIIGTIHHDRGNGRSALDAWNTVLASNPDAANLQISPEEFFAMVGEELLDSGFPDRAVEYLERSSARLPTGRTFALLGSARSQIGQQQAAVSAWTESIRHEPANPTAREELANFALQNGNAQEAVDMMKPLMNSSDLSSSSAYVLQRAFTQLNDADQAQRWRLMTDQLREQEKQRGRVSELLRTSRDPFLSTYLRAYQLAQQEKWNDADRILQDLLIQHPEDARVQALAAAVRKRGDLPELADQSTRPDSAPGQTSPPHDSPPKPTSSQ